jgi:uncharacterized protein (UPF0335 family)
MDLKSKLTFDNIYKVIVIIAIGWLAFSALSFFNTSSKKLDRIEQSQIEVMQKAKDVLLHNQKFLQKTDSLDKIKNEQIKNLLQDISSVRNETKRLNESINSYKKTFDKNKINLPNPWKE